jgi:hypothetical protein
MKKKKLARFYASSSSNSKSSEHSFSKAIGDKLCNNDKYFTCYTQGNRIKNLDFV